MSANEHVGFRYALSTGGVGTIAADLTMNNDRRMINSLHNMHAYTCVMLTPLSMLTATGAYGDPAGHPA